MNSLGAKKVKREIENDEPIRVLHLIDRITGYGTTKLLWDIVTLSPSDKVKHFVISFSPDKGKWPEANRLRSRGMYDQLPKRRVMKILDRIPMTWFLVRYVTTVWLVLKSLIRFRPNRIFVHTGYALTIGLLFKVILRYPVVHLVPALFAQMVDEKKSWIPRFYAKFHSQFDCFFSPSDRCRDELLSTGIPDCKIISLRGLLHLEDINAARNLRHQYDKKLRETYQLPSDALIALSVGRLDASKGHIFALESIPFLLPKFPMLHWLVVGEGKQREELEDRTRALRIASHVHFAGYQDDLIPYYAAATVYLRTMIFEATNLSTYMAMAMGLPIVGFDTGCEAELLKTVCHGILVPNKSVHDLASAVAQILALPDHGRELGRRGREYSQANLDIRRAIEDMVVVFENLKNGVNVKNSL